MRTLPHAVAAYAGTAKVTRSSTTCGYFVASASLLGELSVFPIMYTTTCFGEHRGFALLKFPPGNQSQSVLAIIMAALVTQQWRSG